MMAETAVNIMTNKAKPIMTNSTKTLSIVIPAYNEANFIGALLEKIAKVNLTPLGLQKEIVVVNDCSVDQTAQIVREFTDVTLLEHTVNSGKGMAVRTGLDRATGDFLIIQDADLEYDPEDYIPMLEPLLNDQRMLSMEVDI
ncbi:MAG: glycosyltransferase [Gammaproteobacteria bacterium]|nr:glycosyltransferase [Gammaproteobacteria bacterium]